jgi:hypothetical protein
MPFFFMDDPLFAKSLFSCSKHKQDWLRGNNVVGLKNAASDPVEIVAPPHLSPYSDKSADEQLRPM